MELKKQVTSLESSRKLKKLGIKQDSSWYWIHCVDEKYHLFEFNGLPPSTELISFSAFTVAELGEMLPNFEESAIHSMGNVKYFHFKAKGVTQSEAIEAEARAKMLIYLIENKLIKGNQ